MENIWALLHFQQIYIFAINLSILTTTKLPKHIKNYQLINRVKIGLHPGVSKKRAKPRSSASRAGADGDGGETWLELETETTTPQKKISSWCQWTCLAPTCVCVCVCVYIYIYTHTHSGELGTAQLARVNSYRANEFPLVRAPEMT